VHLAVSDHYFNFTLFADIMLRSPTPVPPPLNEPTSASVEEQPQKSTVKKVVFRPWWNDNPYQQLLANHLEVLGVEVRKVGIQTHLPIHGGKPDVIHLHWLHPFFLPPKPTTSVESLLRFLVGLSLLKLMGVKIVWTAHNLKDHDNRNPLADKICTRAVVRMADRIIAHSETAKRETLQAFSIRNSRKVAVVPHGNYVGSYENTISRAEARTQLCLPESSLVLLFLGSIRPYKGVLELIRTFQQLQHPDLRLVIAGKLPDDATEATIKAAIAHHPTIHFIPGFVPDEDIQVYMNACDAVVFPYKDILTSGAVLLAMSFGRACIAPRLGAIAEALDDTGSVLYDPQSPTGLLQAMQDAVQRQSDLSQMGHHNRQRADLWSWSSVAEQTLRVYQSCFQS
jgi:beta-1,4-mannosyltransferase